MGCFVSAPAVGFSVCVLVFLVCCWCLLYETEGSTVNVEGDGNEVRCVSLKCDSQSKQGNSHILYNQPTSTIQNNKLTLRNNHRMTSTTPSKNTHTLSPPKHIGKQHRRFLEFKRFILFGHGRTAGDGGVECACLCEYSGRR